MEAAIKLLFDGNGEKHTMKQVGWIVWPYSYPGQKVLLGMEAEMSGHRSGTFEPVYVEVADGNFL